MAESAQELGLRREAPGRMGQGPAESRQAEHFRAHPPQASDPPTRRRNEAQGEGANEEAPGLRPHSGPRLPTRRLNKHLPFFVTII